MQQEVSDIMPTDTATMLKQLLYQQRKDKHKVFGRDIFSNKNLSFEPIMNIATPQNYRLGPGDAASAHNSVPATKAAASSSLWDRHAP